jgi:hypothetical protein
VGGARRAGVVGALRTGEAAGVSDVGAATDGWDRAIVEPGEQQLGVGGRGSVARR